jgi:hypothetical protein
MLGAVIILILCAGVGAAYAATRFPAHVVLLERCGGYLTIASLAMLGGALPIY